MLKKEMEELKKENDALRDNNAQGRIQQEELKGKIAELLDSVNKRSNLEERVINIGLSNNYFKNVAEIFKKEIEPFETPTTGGERRR